MNSDELFGRQRELAALTSALTAGGSLLTVWGPGGVGKTRLLWAAVRALRATPSWSTPIVVCELAAVRSVDVLITHILRALELEAVEADLDAAIDLAARAIDGRGGVLLVLDNFEQLAAEGARVLSTLLSRSERAQLLVSSRSQLAVADEEVFALQPFALPTPGSPAERSDAVLFLAARARVDVVEHAAALAEIAARLDGLPLALELAAARLGALSPAQLLARLERPLDVLTKGRRDADPRQATLREAIAWSWELLTEPAQRALALASAFVGGFTLEAGEAVLDAAVALDALQELHEASLLQREGTASAPRFTIFESVREFARERADELELDGASLTDVARRRHAAHFAARARAVHEAWQTRRDPDTRALANALVIDEANLRAVAARAQGEEDRRWALCGLGVLGELRGGALSLLPAFREVLGDASAEHQVVEKAQVVEKTQVAEKARPSSTAAHAWAWLYRATFARRTGQPVEAVACLTHLVDNEAELAKADPRVLAVGTHLRAMLTGDGALPGGPERTRELVEELAVRCHDDGMRAAHVGNLLASVCLEAGDTEAAANFAQSARAWAEEEGDPVERAAILGTLSRVADVRSDPQALALAEQFALDAEGSGAPRVLVLAKELRGVLRHRAGDLAGAARDLEDAQKLALAQGLVRYQAAAIARLALVDLERGHHVKARARAQLALHTQGDVAVRSRWLLLAVSAAAHAAAADVEAASESLVQAAATLGARGGIGSATVRVVEGLVAAARSRAASRADDPEAARRALDEAAHALVGERLPAEAAVMGRLLKREVDSLARELAGAEPAAAWPTDALVIGPDAKFFRPPEGERVDLEKRPVLRSVLRALTQVRLQTPGEPLSVDALFAAAWPAERASESSRTSRVRMAISSLRKDGLRAEIETAEGGYRLAEGLRVVMAEP